MRNLKKMYVLNIGVHRQLGMPNSIAWATRLCNNGDKKLEWGWQGSVTFHSWMKEHDGNFVFLIVYYSSTLWLLSEIIHV